MSRSEEIEVEVVEIQTIEPTTGSYGPIPGTGSPDRSEHGDSRSPFGNRAPLRPIRIPAYLWPLAVIFGLILLILAALIAVVIILPFLIIRAVFRLFFGPSRG